MSDGPPTPCTQVRVIGALLAAISSSITSTASIDTVSTPVGQLHASHLLTITGIADYDCDPSFPAPHAAAPGGRRQGEEGDRLCRRHRPSTYTQ